MSLGWHLVAVGERPFVDVAAAAVEVGAEEVVEGAEEVVEGAKEVVEGEDEEHKRDAGTSVEGVGRSG